MVDSSHRWLPLLALLLCLKLPTCFPFCGPVRHRNFQRTSLVAKRSFPENYWKVLGVEPGSSVKEVKKVYRQRAKKEHPDVNKSPDALKRWRLLSDAYGKLIDPVYRKEWGSAASAGSSKSFATSSVQRFHLPKADRVILITVDRLPRGSTKMGYKWLGLFP